MATVKPIVQSPNHLVYTGQAPLTAMTGGGATSLGRGMGPNFHAPLLPDASFQARGLGKFDLTESVPGTDPRFPRGPRLSGRQGTLDVWYIAPTAGSARDIVALTDNNDGGSPSTQVILISIDATNRPEATLIDKDGNTVGATAASGSAIAAGQITHVRLVWDSLNPVPGAGGGRYAALQVNGALVPVADWTGGTNPVAAWVHFPATHVWLGHAHTNNDFVVGGIQGTVYAFQGSETPIL